MSRAAFSSADHFYEMTAVEDVVGQAAVVVLSLSLHSC